MPDIARLLRFEEYLKSCNPDMDMDEFIFNILVVNNVGSGKDLLLNADISYHYVNDECLFHDILFYVLRRPNYMRRVNNVYASCKLNRDVYGDDYYLLSSIKDVRDAIDGLVYVNDGEKWFNSRGFSFTKPTPELIDIVNNKRKDGILLKMSAHRFMSIDVKIRELFQLIIVPDIFLKPDCDYRKVSSYVVLCKLLDINGNELFTFSLSDLWKYCGLYDTREKAVPVVNDL